MMSNHVWSFLLPNKQQNNFLRAYLMTTLPKPSFETCILTFIFKIHASVSLQTDLPTRKFIKRNLISGWTNVTTSGTHESAQFIPQAYMARWLGAYKARTLNPNATLHENDMHGNNHALGLLPSASNGIKWIPTAYRCSLPCPKCYHLKSFINNETNDSFQAS